jgi:hypothetical protein
MMFLLQENRILEQYNVLSHKTNIHLLDSTNSVLPFDIGL